MGGVETINSVQVLHKLGNVINGNGRNSVCQVIRLVTWINDPNLVYRKVLEGDVHRTADTGRVGVFELEPVAPARPMYEQIQFSAGMSCPEVGVTGVKQSDHLFQGKALPRCPEFWMRLEVGKCLEL